MITSSNHTAYSSGGIFRRWLLVFSFCLFFIPARAASDPETNKHVSALTQEGLALAYNFSFDSAASKFREAQTVSPLHPRPLVGNITTLFWRFAFGNDDKLYEQLIAEADRAIDVAERFADANERDADALVCLGSLYGYKAFAHARQKSYFNAAWDGKKSYSYFTDAVELNPKTYDAYMGLGCYHYFASFAPKALQWVISLLGVRNAARNRAKARR